MTVGTAQRPASSVALQSSAVSYDFESLYSFKGGTDGANPVADLIEVDGNLYGTTAVGGASRDGTVFEVSRSGTERVLYSFSGTDGAGPVAGLIDVDGDLYGTTDSGGASGHGTVFEVSRSGRERVIYSFKGPPDGALPEAGLINVNGDLYGTTADGGANGHGTVFEVSKSGTERVLYSFKGGTTDGATPVARLIAVDGDLYGTTVFGGASVSGTVVNGDGTVFEVSKSGTERVLYSFKGGTDGIAPLAGLIDVNGALYGTTAQGGGESCSGYGCGTVFEVSRSGTERVLYSFKGGTDGAFPAAGLIAVNGHLKEDTASGVSRSRAGLYGTTRGLLGSGAGGALGNGTVFEVSTSGTERVLHTFGSGTNGANPAASLIELNGDLYGTTGGGGASNEGTIFEISDHIRYYQ